MQPLWQLLTLRQLCVVTTLPDLLVSSLLSKATDVKVAVHLTWHRQ